MCSVIYKIVRGYIITGGPGSGKTMLLGELARRGQTIIVEDARALIQEQAAGNGDALPWKNASRFADLLLERSIATWDRISADPSASIKFFDRGIGDALACAELLGHALPATLLTQARLRRYRDPVFLTPWWPEIYLNDAERRQSREEAERTEHVIAHAYRELGYRIVALPRVSPSARADFVLSQIAAARA